MALDRSVVQDVLEEASHLAGEARERFLGARCEGNAELREEVESLLSALERSPEATMTQAVRFAERPVDGVGDQIGPYKLRQQIGEGGFGVVYMAEQTRPVRRTVALKIIKQALALMDHPNIAKVLDGGATPTGRPYFVMELVRGVPITEYCDVNQLELRDRLELFVAVCQAVQHAHQKGIIHRDIKPGNVLVTMADGRPTPKVIDFGIAKATDQRLTERTLFTEFRQMIGTPAYMSPEQAEMAGIDVDTRSDVYSLGVLLYELLVGATPFGAEELRDKAYGEMQRIIREVEPPRPSTKLSTMPETLASVAAQRRIEPRRLAQTLRGELDWIVMRAMEKDRTRRYETPNGLAADVGRYLAGEPVQAAPPTKSYLLRKFLRRHRGPAVAGAVVALALVLGVIGTTVGLMRANHERARANSRLFDAKEARAAESIERDRAQRSERAATAAAQIARENEKEALRQARKSGQVAKFMKEMLSGVSPMVAQGRDTSMLREILDRAAQRVVVALKDQPEAEADLLKTLGATYWDLNENRASEQMYREVLRLRRLIHPGDHVDVADAMEEEARALRGITKYHHNAIAEAESLARQAVEMLERIPDAPKARIARAKGSQALMLAKQLKYKEAEAVYREAVSMGVDEKKSLEWYSGLAVALGAQGKFDEAIEWHEREVRLSREVARETGMNIPIWDLMNYAGTLLKKGDEAGAERLMLEALRNGQAHYAPGHTNVTGPLRHLIDLYRKQGRMAEVANLERQINSATRPSTQMVRWDQAGASAGETAIDPRDFIVRDDATTSRSTGQPELATASKASTRRAKPEPPLPLPEGLLKVDTTNPGEALARHGDFRGAAAELAQHLKGHPKDSESMLRLAAVLAELSATDTYTKHCHDILLRSLGAADYVPRRISKACLLMPLEPDDTRAASDYVDSAWKHANEGSDAQLKAYVAMLKGLAEYRLGHYPAAIQWTSQGMSGLKGIVADSGYCVIAMANRKLQHPAEASEALQKAERAIEPAWFRGTQRDLGPQWKDVIMAHVLLREAKETGRP